jgi:hypothetical protein
VRETRDSHPLPFLGHEPCTQQWSSDLCTFYSASPKSLRDPWCCFGCGAQRVTQPGLRASWNAWALLISLKNPYRQMFKNDAVHNSNIDPIGPEGFTARDNLQNIWEKEYVNRRMKRTDST